MENVHHLPTKSFVLKGRIEDDSLIWKLKNEYCDLVYLQMDNAGYVERIDMKPEFRLQYNEWFEFFSFELIIHGVYVGKKKREWTIGVRNNAGRHTLPNRCNEYLSEAL